MSIISRARVRDELSLKPTVEAHGKRSRGGSGLQVVRPDGGQHAIVVPMAQSSRPFPRRSRRDSRQDILSDIAEREAFTEHHVRLSAVDGFGGPKYRQQHVTTDEDVYLERG